MIERGCEDKWYRIPKFVGVVRCNAPKGCATRISPRGPSLALWAIHLVSCLRRRNRLCSRMVSDTAKRRRKTRCGNPTAVSHFRSGHMSAICARPSKGKGEIHKRVENRRLSILLCARAASAQFRSPRRRNHLKKENLKKIKNF